MPNKKSLIELISLIKTRSENERIPIVRENTITLIQKIIKEHSYKTILEIGTAYGFSASSMLLCDSIKEIITIEKNKSNFQIAQSFLKDLQKIKCINQDAFEYEPLQKFDLIFIDGSKSHQDILVNKYLSYLNQNGLMIVDNIFLKKFEQQKILTKNQKKLVDKLNQFHD
jgi:predicted O-methyltransferase YrrM